MNTPPATAAAACQHVGRCSMQMCSIAYVVGRVSFPDSRANHCLRLLSWRCLYVGKSVCAAAAGGSHKVHVHWKRAKPLPRLCIIPERFFRGCFWRRGPVVGSYYDNEEDSNGQQNPYRVMCPRHVLPLAQPSRCPFIVGWHTLSRLSYVLLRCTSAKSARRQVRQHIPSCAWEA